MNEKKMIKITMDNLNKSFEGSNAVLEPSKGTRKYSEIFHDFMAPYIEETIDDKKLLNDVFNWGQIIWNFAVAQVFPNHPKSSNIQTLFPVFWATFSDKEFLTDFINRKRALFGKDAFFIIKQSSLLDSGGRLAISVVVDQIEDNC